MVLPINSLLETVAPSPVTEAQAWIAGRQFPEHKPLLNIAQAVPGYPPADELIEHLAEVLKKPETALYTGIYGLPELRSAVAEHMMAEYGGLITARQVAIVAGCNQGFCVVMNALAKAGDEVILPLPYYFNHQMWLQSQGIKTVCLPFNETTALPDVEHAAALITQRTRAIALVTPNNPTGAVFPPQLISAYYELAKQHNLALVLDETYKDFRAVEGAAHQLFQQSDWPEQLVQLFSFSKSYCLTGYRVGSIIASEVLLEQLGKILDCITICAPHIGQKAALYGLNHLDHWCRSNNQLMQQRMAALQHAFSHPDLQYRIVASGAYFAYVKHPFIGQAATQVAKRLADQHNILCLPGDNFGPGQDAYLRFAFANLEAEQMQPLVARLLESQV